MNIGAGIHLLSISEQFFTRARGKNIFQVG